MLDSHKGREEGPTERGIYKMKMKHFLKGTAAVVIAIIIDIIINVICNMQGMELGSIAEAFMRALAVICALVIYHMWTRNENKES